MEQTATALQLAFEECVIESFNLYEMATKGEFKLNVKYLVQLNY